MIHRRRRHESRPTASSDANWEQHASLPTTQILHLYRKPSGSTGLPCFTINFRGLPRARAIAVKRLTLVMAVSQFSAVVEVHTDPNSSLKDYKCLILLKYSMILMKKYKMCANLWFTR